MPTSPIHNAQAISVLRKLPVFQGLTETEYLQVLSVCNSEFRREGATLFSEGEDGRDLFVVLSGEIEVSLAGRGVLGTLRAGEVLGEMALVRKIIRSATATVSRPCMLLRVDADALQSLLDKHPRIGYRTMRNIADILADRLEQGNRREPGR